MLTSSPPPPRTAAVAAAAFAIRCSRTALSRDDTDETLAAKPIGRRVDGVRPDGDASLTTDAGESGKCDSRGSAVGRSMEIVKGAGEDSTAGDVATGELAIAMERRERKLPRGVVALCGSAKGKGCCRVYSREKFALDDAPCRYADGASVMALDGGRGDGSALFTADVRRDTIRDATTGVCSTESDRRLDRSWPLLKASRLPGREVGELTGCCSASKAMVSSVRLRHIDSVLRRSCRSLCNVMVEVPE
jgi:hypothetical protein